MEGPIEPNSILKMDSDSAKNQSSSSTSNTNSRLNESGSESQVSHSVRDKMESSSSEREEDTSDKLVQSEIGLDEDDQENNIHSSNDQSLKRNQELDISPHSSKIKDRVEVSTPQSMPSKFTLGESGAEQPNLQQFNLDDSSNLSVQNLTSDLSTTTSHLSYWNIFAVEKELDKEFIKHQLSNLSPDSSSMSSRIVMADSNNQSHGTITPPIKESHRNNLTSEMVAGHDIHSSGGNMTTCNNEDISSRKRPLISSGSWTSRDASPSRNPLATQLGPKSHSQSSMETVKINTDDGRPSPKSTESSSPLMNRYPMEDTESLIRSDSFSDIEDGATPSMRRSTSLNFPTKETMINLLQKCKAYVEGPTFSSPYNLTSSELKGKDGISSPLTKVIQLKKTIGTKKSSSTSASGNSPISSQNVQDSPVTFDFDNFSVNISKQSNDFLTQHIELFKLLLSNFIFVYPQTMNSHDFLHIRSCCNLVLQDMILRTNGECLQLIMEKATDRMELFSMWLRQFFFVISDKDYWIRIEKHIPEWLRTKMDDSSNYFSKRKMCLHQMIRLCWERISGKKRRTNTKDRQLSFQLLLAVMEATQWVEHTETAYLYVEIVDKLLVNLHSIHDSQEIFFSLWVVCFILPSYMLVVHPNLEEMLQRLLMVIVRCVEILTNGEIDESFLYPGLSQLCHITYALFPVSFTKYIREKCNSLQPYFMKMMSHVRSNPRIYLSERKEYSNKAWSQIDRKELISDMFLHNATFSHRFSLHGSLKNFESSIQKFEKDLSRESWWQKISTLQNLIDFHFTSNHDGPINYSEDINSLQRHVLTLKNELLVERSLRAQYAAYLRKISTESSRRLQYDSIIQSQKIQNNHYQTEIKILKDDIKRRIHTEEETRNRVKFWGDKLQDTIANQAEKIEILTQRNLGLNEKLDRLESRNEELEKKLISKDQQIFSLQAQISATAAVQEKLKQNEIQLESLKQEVQMWESNHTKINNTINRMRMMTGEMVFQEQYVSGLRQRVNDYQKQYRNLVSTLQSKTDLIQKMLQEGEKIKQDNAELKKLLQQEQTLAKNRIMELERRYKNTRNATIASAHQLMEFKSSQSSFQFLARKE